MRKIKVFGEFARGENEGALRVGFTGMPAITIENQLSLKHDLLMNTATSFLGVLLIFMLMFRSCRLAWNFTWTTACAAKSRGMILYSLRNMRLGSG